MNTVTALLINADKNHIIVDTTAPDEIGSSIIDFRGQAIIGISSSACSTSAETAQCLAHELGHFHTGTYYTLYSSLQLQEKCEYQADIWMVNKLVPKTRLKKALKDGYTEIWQLAEYFDVPESVILRAAYIYKCKNIL